MAATVVGLAAPLGALVQLGVARLSLCCRTKPGVAGLHEIVARPGAARRIRNDGEPGGGTPMGANFVPGGATFRVCKRVTHGGGGVACSLNRLVEVRNCRSAVGNLPDLGVGDRFQVDDVQLVPAVTIAEILAGQCFTMKAHLVRRGLGSRRAATGCSCAFASSCPASISDEYGARHR